MVPGSTTLLCYGAEPEKTLAPARITKVGSPRPTSCEPAHTREQEDHE